jgi:aspartate ammonia-lyase
MRTELDFLGEVSIPANALYGIHSIRARENFPDRTPFFQEWFQAVGLVKLACYEAYSKFMEAAKVEKLGENFRWIDISVLQALKNSAVEVSEGNHFDQFLIPAIQGGAGTSINLNINEIIANRSLQILGNKPGEYQIVDPFEDANVFQSTNDVIPTSLKIAGMFLLNALEKEINTTRSGVESIEQEHRDHLRTSYTQMQEAVPSSFGRLFSTYSEALSRDWWRVSKCFERIKVVNLGGGAIGSGIAIPKFFIMQVVQELQKITQLPVTRGENLQDATANLDSLVEVHAILKAHAVNLEKMVSDIRLLASDLSHKEIEIPNKQVGSSIMPGKVNPVITEFVICGAHKVYANDMLITGLCGQGCLDLNAYIPTIGHALIESLKTLIACNNSISNHLLTGLKVHEGMAKLRLYHSLSITTALVPYIGYHKAAELAYEMKKSGTDIFQSNLKLQLIEKLKLEEILKPENLLKMGYSLKDI